MTEDELLGLPSFIYKNQVDSLIAVLNNHFQIDHFNFARFHFEYGQLSLSNGLNFALEYWDKYAELDRKMLFRNFNGTHLLIYEKIPTNQAELLFVELREQRYNLPAGVVLIKYYKTHIDIFHFASTHLQQDRIHPILREQCLLEQYGGFFIKEMSAVINNRQYYTVATGMAELQAIQESLNKKTYKPQLVASDSASVRFEQQTFLLYRNVKLTPAETRCVLWALHGKTAIEISSILNNSKRTIEKHLLTFRTKFDCERLSQAIERAKQLGFIHNDEVFETSLMNSLQK